MNSKISPSTETIEISLKFKVFCMTIITYFWLKSKMYHQKVSIIANNAFTQAIGFIKIDFFSSFRCINSIIFNM